MINDLGQRYSIQTFDQQLYAIAKQVGWAMSETFKTHIVRLGGFHTLSCFIASIGKLSVLTGSGNGLTIPLSSHH
jgi:hypothetical protein